MAPPESSEPSPSAPSAPSAATILSGALSWLRARPVPPPADAHERLALLIHALLLQHGFRSAHVASDNTASYELPTGWASGAFGGAYRHVRSAMSFDIRAVRMAGRLVIHAAAVESDAHMYTIDIRVAEYVAEMQQNADADANVNDANENAAETASSWAGITRTSDVATLVAVQLANRLIPDNTKPGYEHAAEEATTATGSSSTPTPRPQPGPRPIPPSHPSNDPLRIGPPRNPGLVDPLRIGPPRMPGTFGRDDLIAPGLQGFPRHGMPHVPGMEGGFGGNLMGPRAFRPRPGGRLPGVPPGARFDPVYPIPDNDAEHMPGFEDEHALRPRGGGNSGGGVGDDGPPPDMYW